MNAIRKKMFEFSNECLKKNVGICFQKNEIKFDINLFYYMFESWILNYFIDLEMWFIDLKNIINSKYSSIYDNRNQIFIYSESNYDDWVNFSTLNNKLNNLIRNTYTKLDTFNYNLWEFNYNTLLQNEFNINNEELDTKTKKVISKLDIKEEIKKLNNLLNNKEQKEEEDIILRSSLGKGWNKKTRNQLKQ